MLSSCDLQVRGDDVAQQPERLALRLRRGSAAKASEALRARVAPRGELVEQPALADACIGDDADDGEPALAEQPLERVLERLELGVAPDHVRRDAFDAATAETKAPRLRAQHEVAPDRLVDALDGHRLLRLDLEAAAHLRVGSVADAQRAGRRGLLHAGGDVDRDAADGRVGIDAAAEQHRSGVHAGADVEGPVAVRSAHFSAEHLAELEQREAAAHGALGVVFASFGRAEDREHVVAGVLQHLASVRLDDRRRARQRVVHHGADRFRVEVLRERGRADHVHEQDAHLLERLRRSARRCCRAGERSELDAGRRQQRFDQRIPERGPLTFERGDRGFELLHLRHRRRG